MKNHDDPHIYVSAVLATNVTSFNERSLLTRFTLVAGVLHTKPTSLVADRNTIPSFE